MDYKELYEKRAKTEKIRAYFTIITAALSVAAAVLMLKQLRSEVKLGGRNDQENPRL